MKIGITLDMSVAFWSNGMQQNIVFLYSMLERAGFSCNYITSKKPSWILNKKHKGMLLDDFLSDDGDILDLLIIAGFDLLPSMYERLRVINPKMKIVFLHFGNKLMDDIHYSISCKDTPKLPVDPPDFFDEVWIYPHHSFAREYLSCYYRTDNVVEVPYVWSSFFLDDKIKALKNKGLSPYYDLNRSSSVCIFEPNISHIKNCIIPISICEKLEILHPGSLSSVNVFCCEHLRGKSFFEKLMGRMNIVKRGDFCYFNKKWGSTDALSKFGSVVVSHQTYSELNFNHFETLYLGLPLIHNSELIQNYGYYYPDFDISFAAKQLRSSVLNHQSFIEQYKTNVRTLIRDYSPYESKNINKYKFIINELFK